MDTGRRRSALGTRITGKGQRGDSPSGPSIPLGHEPLCSVVRQTKVGKHAVHRPLGGLHGMHHRLGTRHHVSGGEDARTGGRTSLVNDQEAALVSLNPSVVVMRTFLGFWLTATITVSHSTWSSSSS